MKQFSPSRPISVPLLAAVLFVLIAAALVANNYTYLFKTSLYEFEDLAVNSLQITRAKHFHELYGQYSRWNFHHPGPGVFYQQGWGELLFHDWLHLVPRPLNAQFLAALLLNVFFIATVLATATAWMGRKTLFLPLAMLCGILHVVAIRVPPDFPLGALMLIGNWPDYTIVIPFAALIVFGASVAAGRGASLPLLALACCFLEHSHVAQPLFIVPVALLAYAGLLFSCRRTSDTPPMAEDSGEGSRRWSAWLLAPYRRSPHAHWLAAACIGLFILPILIDACWGSRSNLAQILVFYRAHQHDPHKKLLRAFIYFLQFALYTWYDPTRNVLGRYDANGVMHFLRSCHFVCELWVTGLLGSGAVMLSWLRRPAAAATGAEADAPEILAVRARRRYIVWLWACLALTFLLTLHWGQIMTGEMVSYNAFFNYGFMYALILAMVATVSDYLAQYGVGSTGPWPRVFLYGLILPLFVVESSNFRVGDYAANPAYAQIIRSMDAALKTAGPDKRPIMLTFFTGGYDRCRASEIGLELARRGVPFLVEKPMALCFTPDQVADDPFRAPADPQNGPPFRTWQVIAPPFANLSPGTCVWPLLDPSVALVTGEREIDPAAGVAVSFGDGQRDCINVAPVGWELPGKGIASAWSVDRCGQVSFRAHPVADGATVRLTVDAVPLIVAGKLASQRMEISLNGKSLGTWTRREPGAFEVTIPAATWNAQTDAWLTFSFPDATEPAKLGINPEDHRLLAFAFTRIGFRAAMIPRRAPPEGPGGTRHARTSQRCVRS